MSLPKNWDVPARFKERLGEKSGKQRAMFHDKHLLIILHAMPDKTKHRHDAVYFWRNPKGKWHSSERGNGLVVLREHLAKYEEALDKLEKRYSSESDAREYFDILGEVTPLLRAANRMTDALQSAREAVEDKDIITARDRGQDLVRGFELLHSEAKNGIDYATARKAEEQAILSQELAKAGHRFNVLAALFLPLTAIASAFGMNLASGLDNRSPLFFWAILAGSAFLGFIVWAMIGIGGGGGDGREKDRHRPKWKRKR